MDNPHEREPRAPRPDRPFRSLTAVLPLLAALALALPAPSPAQRFRPARYADEESNRPPIAPQAPARQRPPAAPISWRAARTASEAPGTGGVRFRRAVVDTSVAASSDRNPGSERVVSRNRNERPRQGVPRRPVVHSIHREAQPSSNDVRHAFRPAQHTQAFRKPLPQQILSMPTVQESMEVIHHRSQLLIARSRISRTAIADDSVIDIVQFSPNEISVIGVGLGTTTLTIWFEDNPRPLIYLVKTVPDPGIEEQRNLDYGKLERRLRVLFPNSKVYLIPLSGKIVVKGQARDSAEAARILQIVRNEVINQQGTLYGPQPGRGGAAAAAANSGLANAGYPGRTGAAGTAAGGGLSPFDLASYYVINMLEVPGEFQVMLRVRIAELNRSQLRRMGIDFNYIINNGRHFIGYSLGGIPSTITGIFNNGEVSVLIDWLASNGTAKILSEPVLTVLSGHTASMLSGGEFAVPTIVGIGGAQGQQTRFRGFGTSLFVTPTVMDKDLIRMTIVPEFSAVNQQNSVNGIPGVDSRRVATTVQLREGQTIAIAGLIAHQMNTEVVKIPFLGDLPYVGPKLFAAKRHTQEETELLVLVTPEIVRPMDADEVPPVPGFYVTPPAEHPLYHYGITEGAPDLEYYQLAPYGRGAGMGEPVGYRLHNPSPATPGYPPEATDPYGAFRNSPNGRQVPPVPPTRQHRPAPPRPKPPQQGPNRPDEAQFRESPPSVPWKDVPPPPRARPADASGAPARSGSLFSPFPSGGAGVTGPLSATSPSAGIGGRLRTMLGAGQ